MNRIAPPELAQDWDNVGLLWGDHAAPLKHCLFCIDMTRDVLNEAVLRKCDAVIAYHPPLFKGVKSLRLNPGDRGPGASLAFEAIRAGIAVYSPHTALDAAPDGTGDAIAVLCGARVLGPLSHAVDARSAAEVKLVTFVPQEHVDRVMDALSSAGAGVIGNYTQCGFRIPGTGTFFGSDETAPVVGRKGRLETVAEIRLEVVCNRANLASAVAALRQAHPYEEPAFDLYPLTGKPRADGIGRLAELPKAVRLSALASMLAQATKSTCAQIVGDPKRSVRRLAILVGSAGRLHEEYAAARTADVIVTGEIRHHDALSFDSHGYAAIALGHWHSERPVLATLSKSLRSLLPGLSVTISKADRDPFRRV